MKKGIGVLVILLAGMVPNFALGQLSVGLRGGINSANMKEKSNDPDYDYTNLQSVTGANFALLVNYRFGDTPLSIQLEPGYSQRGTQIKLDETSTSNGVIYRQKSEERIKANYFEMPVLLRFSPQIGSLQGIFSLGPEFGFLSEPMRVKSSSSSYEDGVLTENKSTEENMDWGDGFRKTNFGIVAGIGIALPVDKIKFFVEGRYHYGFAFYSNTSYSSGTTPTYYEKLSNRGVSLSLGILYQLGN